MRLPSGPVSRIAVFRALMLGDMLCATPALRALRGAFPGAEITLISLPWARELAERLDTVDEFIPFPGYPGLPEVTPDLHALPDFFSRVQAKRFDLAVQLHGSGQIVNALVGSFGARVTAGFTPHGADCLEPDISAPWPQHGHEIERLLVLTDRLGAPRRGVYLDFPCDDADRQRVTQWSARHGPYVVIHPGSQLASRRWPVERFAAVAKSMVERGWQVVLTGTSAEAALTRVIVTSAAAGRDSVHDRTGETTLWELGASVEDAALVIANDTGISHIAAAVRTPSVIISCGADAARWAPLDRARHRVLAAEVPCRPCSNAICPTAHECAVAIGVDQVLDTIDSLLEPAYA